jgi:hypothetical protein
MKRYTLIVWPALIGITTECVLAQNYPARPIRLVVASSPGGASDILGRMLAQKLSDEFGQQVVVDNRGGASGVIGTDIVAKAAPDGYTLLIIQTSLTINPSMISKLPYDAVRDFAPVSLVVDAAQIMTVNPTVAAKNVKELIALAKAKPGTLMFGSPGVGTSPHLTAELFKLVAGMTCRSALQRLGNGLRQPDLGRSFGRVLYGPVSNAPRQKRQDPRAWRDDSEARCGCAGCADDRGIGVAGVRELAVVRHSRAGAHAASDRRPFVRGSAARIQQSGSERALDP